jgi:type IV secretory pathway component VirB8
MTSISEPQEATLPPIELSESRKDTEQDMRAKNDSHMAIRISATPEYNKGSRFQEEHDSLLDNDVTDDVEDLTQRHSILRSKWCLIIFFVIAAFLIIGAIACKCSSKYNLLYLITTSN